MKKFYVSYGRVVFKFRGDYTIAAHDLEDAEQKFMEQLAGGWIGDETDFESNLTEVKE